MIAMLPARKATMPSDHWWPMIDPTRYVKKTSLQIGWRVWNRTVDQKPKTYRTQKHRLLPSHA